MANGLSRRHWCIVAALLIASVAFYAAAWRGAPYPAKDSWSYATAARDLADGRLEEIHVRTPGYPLLLLLTGTTNGPAWRLYLVQLALHSAAVLLVVWTLGGLGVAAWRTFCATFVLLLPPAVEPAARFLSESLTEFLLVAGTVCLLTGLTRQRTTHLWCSGLLFSWLALTRPTFQLLSIALAALVVAAPLVCRPLRMSKPHGAAAAAALVVPWLLVVGGFGLHNYLRFDCACLTTDLGFQLSNKTLRALEELPDEHAAARDILIAHRDRWLVTPHTGHRGFQFTYSARPELQQRLGMPPDELAKYLVKLNLELIRLAPGTYLSEVGFAAVSYWFPAPAKLANFNSRALQFLWGLVHFAVVGLFVVVTVLVAGSVALYLLGHGPQTLPGDSKSLARHLTVVVLATILCYTMAVSTAVGIGETRFRQPTDILLVLMLCLELEMWAGIRRAGLAQDMPGVGVAARNA